MTTRICAICEDEFNLNERIKQKRGKITHCGDCCEETSVRYAGVAGADGKQASVSILRFDSVQDREQYLDCWQNNSGLHKNKGCQIGRGLKSTPAVKFQTVAVFEGNVNAKGKA